MRFQLFNETVPISFDSTRFTRFLDCYNFYLRYFGKWCFIRRWCLFARVRIVIWFHSSLFHLKDHDLQSEYYSRYYENCVCWMSLNPIFWSVSFHPKSFHLRSSQLGKSSILKLPLTQSQPNLPIKWIMAPLKKAKYRSFEA